MELKGIRGVVVLAAAGLQALVIVERERGGGGGRGSLLCGMAVSAIAGKRVVVRVAVCGLAFEC